MQKQGEFTWLLNQREIIGVACEAMLLQVITELQQLRSEPSLKRGNQCEPSEKLFPKISLPYVKNDQFQPMQYKFCYSQTGTSHLIHIA